MAYVGEIRMVGFPNAPKNWVLCDGRTLSASTYPELFRTIQFTYGGDYVDNFCVPNFLGRIMVHQGQGADGVMYQVGASGGSEQVILTANTVAAHAHSVYGTTTTAQTPHPINNSLPAAAATAIYSNGLTQQIAMGTTDMPTPTVPHENRMPFQCINYIIALYGEPPPPASEGEEGDDN